LLPITLRPKDGGEQEGKTPLGKGGDEPGLSLHRRKKMPNTRSVKRVRGGRSGEGHYLLPSKKCVMRSLAQRQREIESIFL